MEPIRVLVVDDSIFMRRTISKLISSDQILVVDTACNGREAIDKIIEHNPDIVTLDIEMPIMNGLEALKEIMENHPLPVLMLSTLTSDGADATIEALSNGAIDFITKKAAFTEMNSIKDELIEKILSIGKNSSIKNQLRRKSQLINMKKNINKTDESDSGLSKKLIEKARQKSSQSTYKTSDNRPKNISIVTIGISTGGPVALNDLLSHLPGNIPVPILIAQHMPPYFTKSLAERLNNSSKLNVKEAENGDKAMPGWVYLAPGGKQMTINKRFLISIGDDPKDELYKPSVNVLLGSVAESFSSNSVGIIMTGMGHDGRESAKKVKSSGGFMIAQDLDSCVVPGMPKSIIDNHLADEIHSLSDMPEAIASLFGLQAI